MNLASQMSAILGGNNPLLQKVRSGVSQEQEEPEEPSGLAYDLFDSGGRLISRGQNAVDILNPGGPGTKLAMARQAQANGAMLNEEQQELLGQKMGLELAKR